MPQTSPVTTDFCINNKGDVVSLDFVEECARRIKNWYLSTNPNPANPVSISSDDELAPIYIASFWLAGIPFYTWPVKVTEDIRNTVLKAIQPHYFLSTGNVQVPASTLQHVLMGELPFHDEIPLETVNKEAVFGYFLTSGTTSAPKVVALKRVQIMQATKSAALNKMPGRNERWLLSLPLNHVGGTALILRSLINGNGIADYRKAGIEEIGNALAEKDDITMVSMVPTQLAKLFNIMPNFKPHKNFKAVLLGGGPSGDELLKKARECDLKIIKSYGMTETCAQITAVPYEKINETDPDSSGMIMPGNEIEIRNEQGTALPVRTEGVIWLRGIQVIKEYVHPPEAKQAFDDKGWFNTGDYGLVDDNGHLFVKMRRQDVIITGGENVNPVTIEAELLKLDGVEDACVIGVEDAYWGQAVTAFVVCAQSAFKPDEWKKALRSRLNKFEIPQVFYLIDEIPRNETGKIQRNKLKISARSKI